MVRRRLCHALLLFGAVVLVGAPPAAAQAPSPNSSYQGCHAFVSDATLVPTQHITISGSGANPGDTVTAELETIIATGVADRDGNFAFQATIPATAIVGPGTLTVRCGPNGGLATIMVTIGDRDGVAPTPTTVTSAPQTPTTATTISRPSPGGPGHDPSGDTAAGQAGSRPLLGAPGGARAPTGTGDGRRGSLGARGLVPLARTGTGNPIPLAKLSVGLIVVGGLMLAAARRRRSAGPAAG